MEVLGAFIIGLLGSLHCLGMCGPIAFAVPLDRSKVLSKITGSLTYNLGRLITYFFLGIIFGIVGKGFNFIGLQQWLTISLGVILILSVFTSLLSPIKANLLRSTNKWLSGLKNAIGKRFTRGSYGSLFTIGLLNGILPCGLVYVAIAASLAFGDPLKGGVFMFMFGIGTLPMMLSINISGDIIKRKLVIPFRKTIPYLMVVLGLLFILRGMNLGVPYLSPKMESNQKVSCH